MRIQHDEGLKILQVNHILARRGRPRREAFSGRSARRLQILPGLGGNVGRAGRCNRALERADIEPFGATRLVKSHCFKRRPTSD